MPLQMVREVSPLKKLEEWRKFANASAGKMEHDVTVVWRIAGWSNTVEFPMER